MQLCEINQYQVACCALHCTENSILSLCVSCHWGLLHKRSSPLPPLRVVLVAARAVHRTVDSAPLATAARWLAAPRRNAVTARGLWCDGFFVLMAETPLEL